MEKDARSTESIAAGPRGQARDLAPTAQFLPTALKWLICEHRATWPTTPRKSAELCLHVTSRRYSQCAIRKTAAVWDVAQADDRSGARRL